MMHLFRRPLLAPEGQAAAAPVVPPVVAPAAVVPPVAAPDPLAAAAEGKPAPIAAPGTQTTEPAKVEADPLAAATAPKTEPTPAEKQAADAKSLADAKAKAEAPFVFKVPDGVTPEAKANAESWSPAFKEAGLSPEQAEKLVAFALKNASDPKVIEAAKVAEKTKIDTAFAEKQKQQVAADRAALMADPRLGGANYEATSKMSVNVIGQTKSGAAFAKMLIAKGISNSPELHNFLADIGALIAPDTTGARLKQAAPEPSKIVHSDPISRQAGNYKQQRDARAAAQQKR